MDDFVTRLAVSLDVPRIDAAQIDTLLAVARDVAHGTERKYTPLATFLMGVAVGRGASLDAAVTTVQAAVADAASPEE